LVLLVWVRLPPRLGTEGYLALPNIVGFIHILPGWSETPHGKPNTIILQYKNIVTNGCHHVWPFCDQVVSSPLSGKKGEEGLYLPTGNQNISMYD